VNRLADILPDGPEREAVLKQFGEDADVNVLARSFLETRNKLTSTRRVPGEDATPDDWGKFYSSMGRPDSHEGYGIPESANDTLRVTLESLRQVAHERGLTQSQWQSLADAAGTNAQERMQQVEAQRTEWESQTRNKLGDAADKRLELADHTLAKMMGDDPAVAQVLKETGLDRHPALVNVLLQAGDYMSEDSAPVGASPAQPAGPTPNELYIEAVDIMDSEEFKNKKHPKAALAEARFLEVLMTLKSLGYDQGINDPRFTTRPSAFLPDGTRFI
jgi:hypothetical protein